MFIRSNIGLSNKQLSVYHFSIEWSKRPKHNRRSNMLVWKSLCERWFLPSLFLTYFLIILWDHKQFRSLGSLGHPKMKKYTWHFVPFYHSFHSFDLKKNVFVVTFYSFFFKFWKVFYVTVQLSSHIFIYSKTVKWKTFDIFPRGIYTLWFSCLIQ